MRRLPKPLFPGARIAVCAPSSPAPEAEAARGIACLRAMGFDPVLGASCFGSTPERGYLAAASDRVKLDDLHRAFADPAVDGIVCLRGGSGAGRLLRHLDADLIAAHPKAFVGYSDITALHAFIGANCGFVTFLGPMVTSNNLTGDDSPTRAALWRALTDTAPLGALGNPDNAPLCRIAPGRCRGELVGGNLAVLCTTLGTRADVDTRGKVLFLEDVDEQPYSVDRMLNHLINAGKLDEVAGILLGDFTEAEPPENAKARTVDVVFRDVLSGLGIPVLGGLRCGHGTHNLTLPLGAFVEMDADAGVVRFPEPVLAE